VVIDPTLLPARTDTCLADLDESLEVWRSTGVKVVWLQLPTDRADLVPLAVDRGFRYHHATDDWLQLTLVLVPGSYVPPFATHYIGAGGVVINDANELLVIQERHHRRRHLKLPAALCRRESTSHTRSCVR
jgi:hypothetical protein